MALDVRDIFMVIRAKDQASRVINSVATAAMGDFTKVQRDARLKAQQLGIDMSQMRTKYDRAILQSRERLFAAERAGDADEARAARERIKRLQLVRDAQALNIRQSQIDQRQQALALRQQQAARQAAMEHQRAMARAGGVAIAVGASMVLMGGMGLKALHSMAMGAVEYQRQAALTLTQTDKIKISVQDLQKISNSVAQNIGVPLETLQPALYDIFSSMNVNAKQSQTLLTAFAKEAVAGQVDIQDASRATIGIMNAYHIPVEKVSDVLDFQFQLVRKGVGTFGQFATTIGRSVPSAVRAGQSYQTLGAMLAFLTRNGLSAAMASASAGRALDAMANPRVGRNFANLGSIIAKASGLSAEQLRKLGVDTAKTSIQVKDAQGNFRNIVPVMGELSAVLMKLPPASRAAVLQALFKGAGGTIQAMRFFSVAIPRFAELNALLKTFGDDAGLAEKAYAEMAGTTAAETVRLSNNWKILKNTIGAEAMPQLNNILEWGNKFLIQLHQMDPGQRKLVANTLLYGSAASVALGGIIALSGVIVILNAGLKTASIWWGTVTTRVEAYTLAQDGAIGATRAMLTQLGLLIVAYELAAHAQSIHNKSIELGKTLHEKYVRPVYEFLHLTEGSTDALRTQNGELTTLAGRYGQVTLGTKAANVALTGNYHALTAGEIAANQFYERGLKPVIGGNRVLASSTRAARVQTQAHAVDIKKVSQAIRDALPDFRGMQAQVKMTADEVNRQLRREIKAYEDWATNVQTLIKRGVDPRFIQMLAKRGPEAIAAMAHGNARELHAAVVNWQKEHGAMVRASQISFAKAGAATKDFKQTHAQQVEAARKKHDEKMAAMELRTRRAMIKAGESVAGFRSKANTEFGRIHDEAVKVNATAGIQWSKDAATAKFRAGRMAEGGKITVGTGPKSDDVLLRASKGETVVSAAHSARPEFQSWAKARGIKGYADGGLIGRFSGSLGNTISSANQMMGRAAGVLDKMTFKQLGSMIQKMTVPFDIGGATGFHGSGSWMRAVRELIKDHVAYNIISTFRPGARTHASGALSYHARNRAVDFTGPSLFSIWRSLNDTHPTELIYAYAPYYIARGRAKQIRQLDRITWNDHRTHVHAAYRNGGYVTEPILGVGRSGRTYSFGEAGTERVTPTRRETRPGLAAMGGTSDRSVNVTINTQEVVPEREAQLLGWYLQRRL